MSAFVTKGSRIAYNFMATKPVALAGMQAKLGGIWIAGEGVVKHISADDPEGKVNLRFIVETDDGETVEVPGGGVTGVLIEEDEVPKDA